MDSFVHRMKRAMQRGRSATLPPDDSDALYVLLPYVMQNQAKPVNELLTNSHFDINYTFGRAQRTLVHSAANTGAADCLLILLKREASVNIQDKIGVTPLHLAARNGHKKCVQRLLEAGADISVHDNEGLTVLHWLSCNGRTELLVSILQKGVFVDVEDVHGHTSLHVACQNGHYACVVQLLNNNADLHKRNNNGGNALYFACRHGQVRCVELLLSKGSEVKPDNDGLSTVELCAQSNYYECVLLILLKYPEQVDILLSLICNDCLEEGKMQALLEYISKNSVPLLLQIIGRLATNTCSAGMELLSISSSYKDLMPQFLRAVRMLCTLYEAFIVANIPITPPSATSNTLPDSPRSLSGETSLPNPPNVHRTGSFGSILDSPRAERNTRSVLHFGHRRSHSNSSPTSDSKSSTLPVRSRKHKESVSDPFQELESVWSSLECWFDLVKTELERLQQVPGSTTSTDQDNTRDNLEGVMLDNDNADTKPHPDTLPTVVVENEVPTKKKPILKLQSSALAAAIVNSAPPYRRHVFLQPSRSFENRPDECFSDDSVHKRRSWHVERVTARMLSVLEEAGTSLSTIPVFNRSLSNDQTVDDWVTNGREVPSEESCALPEAEILKKEEDDSVVEVYADRLCAVTHAFALCCSVLQKSNGRSGLHPRFSAFIDTYEAVLKVLLARNPQLIFAHFHFLLENMELLSRFMHIVHAQPFQDRKNWFYENLYHGKPPSTELTLATQSNAIQVDRDKIFTTSCKKIAEVSADDLKSSLSIQFLGEAGMGSGVKREWFDTLSREILNPDYALFTQSVDGATFQPNSLSDVNPDHLSYFKFAGRMMALAIYHQQLLNVYFTRSFYKHILGIPVSYQDVESIDPEYANNLQWVLDNCIDDLGLELTFSVETDVFGATEMFELKPNGSSITVTDANKKEYVQLVTEMRMTQAIGIQIRSFQDGFYEIIPHKLISLYDEYELELLISGLPDIDVDDWEKNTEYSSGYDEDTPMIKWFWEIVRQYESKDLAILLQFVTGSSRVPLGGFSNLVGATGLTKFTVARLDNARSRLPMASTCFNLLKLPEYTSREILKERLSMSLTCGNGIIDIT